MNPHFRFAALALFVGAAVHAQAAEQAIAFDPLTVKAGEEMRITLFNPRPEPIVLRVFSYNSVENTYDEGPSITLAPGKMRFFDLRVTKDFVGLGGVIETVPETPTAAPESKQVKPAIKFEDILVSSVISRGSLQHRTTTGQTQTMGYSFGASQTGGGGWFRTIQSQAQRVAKTEWIQSAIQ